MATTKDWRKHKLKPLSAAFVFMDEATRTGLNRIKARTANTPELAASLIREGGKEFIFADALVGPSDLLAGVRSDSHSGLVRVLKTKIRKSFSQDRFIHKTECHLIVSAEGRLDFSRAGLARPPGDKRADSRPLRAWILATVADPDPDATAELSEMFAENPNVKLLASVVGGYDFFIFVETKDMAGMQKVIDQQIRNRAHFTATDTRFVIDE